MTAARSQPEIIDVRIVHALVALAEDEDLDERARAALRVVLYSDRVQPKQIDVDALARLFDAARDCVRGIASAEDVERIASAVLRVRSLADLDSSG